MIKAIRSNNPNFKTVEFEEGFNVIVADRTSKKEELSSRNGAGKTTLIEIMHFCLGARVDKNSVFKNPHLNGWSFIIDIIFDGTIFSFERFTNDTNKIFCIQGDAKSLGDNYKYDKHKQVNYFTLSDFNKCLLTKMYGLLYSENSSYPSFRDLISYSIRRDVEGFSNPFEYFKRQKASSVQMCNAYFLNLNMEYAKEFQEIKDKKKGIEDYKNAAKSGVIGDINLNVSDLISEVFDKQHEVDELKKQLDSFRILPQYKDISDEANGYTDRLHEYANDLVVVNRLISRYEDNISIENVDLSVEDVESVYKEAGVIFGDSVVATLNEVMEFHHKLISNRKDYLSSELSRLKLSRKTIEDNIKKIDEKRSELMKVLETHGALEEYSIHQDRYANSMMLLDDAKNRLKTAQHVEESNSLLKIENEQLLLKTRKDFNERATIIEKANSIFKKNVEFLYPHSGSLKVNLKDTGYDFSYEIKNSRSQGVIYMMVFCYDMLLMELGKEKKEFSDFIVHDSTVFDGVDERQVAKALILAYEKSFAVGNQYIVLINSDKIPYNEFDDKFSNKFNDSIRLHISDEQETGGLLGIRF